MSQSEPPPGSNGPTGPTGPDLGFCESNRSKTGSNRSNRPSWRHGDLDAIERDLGLRPLIDESDPRGVPRPEQLSATGWQRSSEARGESETVARHRSAFQRDWTKQLGADLSDQPPREPWPAPEIAAREARPEEVPPPAQRLAQTAEANGWATQVVFSRGTSQVGRVDNPEHGPVVDAVSIRCRRGGQVALGYWRAPTPTPPMRWRWAWAFGLARGEYGPKLVGARELRDLVSDEDRVVDPSDGSAVE